MVCLCPFDVHFLLHCRTSLPQNLDPHHLGQQLHWPDLLYVMFMQKRNKYYFSLFIIVCKWLWQDSNEWSPVFSLNKMLLLWLFLWMRLQDVKILSEVMFCFRMIRKICVQWTLKQMSRKWRGGKELKQSWTAKYEKDI